MTANVLFDTSRGDTRTIDGMVIGGTTPAAGSFAALAATSAAVSGAVTAASATVSGAITAGSVKTTGTPVARAALNVVSTGVTSNNINLTAAQLTGGSVEVYVDVQTVISGACTLTLPSVAALVAAMTSAGLNPLAGTTYVLHVYNDQSGSFAFTLTADGGATWTLSGTAQTIAKGTVRRYLVTLTSLVAGTMQSLGEFTVTAAP